MVKNQRESGIELLRILSIFGIIVMHTFTPYVMYRNNFDLILNTIIQSLFNTGVTIFVLISGFFSIKSNLKKVVYFYLIVTFYGIFSLVPSLIMGNAIDIETLAKAFFPIFTRKYWFASCYFGLLILAPYINKYAISADKKEYEKLLFLLIFLLVLIPTFFLDGLMADRGKGFPNMILTYMIGRYLCLYPVNIKKNTLIICGALLFSATGFANILTAKLLHHMAFARDCCINMLLLSVIIFLIFKQMKWKSKIVNFIAHHTFAMYLAEGPVRELMGEYFDLTAYKTGSGFLLIVFGFCIVCMLICVVIDCVRELVFSKADSGIYKIINLIINKLKLRLAGKID